MNDRELLELAAMAAGIEGEWKERVSQYGDYVQHGIDTGRQYFFWNPLTDDGDALRLAVKLDIHVLRFESMTTARPLLVDLGCDERDDGDPYAATRRAIVRAAAEIGKGIQLQTVEGVLEDNYYKSQAEAEELGRQMQEGGAA